MTLGRRQVRIPTSALATSSTSSGTSSSCTSTSKGLVPLHPSTMPLYLKHLHHLRPFRRRLLTVIEIYFFLIFPLSSVCAVTNKDLKYLSEAHFEFSIDLYRQLAASEQGNIVISPQNINLGLAMLFLGSTANTSSSGELRRALHYSDMSYVSIHRGHREALGVLEDQYYKQQDFLSKVRQQLSLLKKAYYIRNCSF